MRSSAVVPVLLVATSVAAPVSAQAPGPAATAPRVSGYLQPRFQGTADTAVFLLRRARFAVEGQLSSWASFRAQVEMRTAGSPATPPSSPLTLSATDLFVRLSHERWGGTVGQFRVPFSLESLLSSTILETTERSRIVTAAKRDIGVQVEWRLPDRLVLQGAVVNGEGPNRASKPDNRMAYFARAVVTPVKGLDVGGAFEWYSDSAAADGQAVYRATRWTARAEYLREHNRRTDDHATGWYALGAYSPTPQRVQVVGRIEQFNPSDRVPGLRVTGSTVGAQYFMRGDNLKLMADYTFFHEQGAQEDNNRAVVQMQVRW